VRELPLQDSRGRANAGHLKVKVGWAAAAGASKDPEADPNYEDDSIASDFAEDIDDGASSVASNSLGT